MQIMKLPNANRSLRSSSLAHRIRHDRYANVTARALPKSGKTAISCGFASGIVLFELNIDRRFFMKISARNRLKGKIVQVTKGATTAHVRIDIGNGVIVTSSITNEAVDELGLAVGGDAYAVVKASDVMIAID